MHFQDSLLCKRKQGEKRNCPYHGTCDNQRNYRTVQLQAERDQGDMGCQGQQSQRQREGTRQLDARESMYVERKVIPDNADPTSTDLNRELVKMPSGAYGRDEVIADRIKTAGIRA